jgi:hypothetical protein
MHNQHAGLSQLLAEQRITQRHEQATHTRLVRGARPPGRRRRSRAAHGWWQLARWPAVAAEQPAAARTAPRNRSEATMSKRTRTLILGATLAAMNLAGLTAVAHAQANHDPDGKDARRPPSERQVGEVWRKRPPVTSQPTTMDAAVRQLLRERSSIPSGTPAQAPAPTPAEPSGQPGWLLASVGVLAAALMLAGGLAVLAAKRAGRRARLGHAA